MCKPIKSLSLLFLIATFFACSGGSKSTGFSSLSSLFEKSGASGTGGDQLASQSGGNQPPTADAGPDQTVTDTDSSGRERVTLDGTGSTDSDGSIVSYAWSENGNPLARGRKPKVNLAVGVHDIALTVTDDDGARGTDVVTVTVNPPGGGWSQDEICGNGVCSADETWLSCGADCGPPPGGNSYYVSPSGGGDCNSPAQACTLNAVQAKLHPLDVTYLASGNYGIYSFNSSAARGAPDAPITYTALDPTNQPIFVAVEVKEYGPAYLRLDRFNILSPSNHTPFWVEDTSYVEFTNSLADGSWPSEKVAVKINGVQPGLTHHIKLVANEIRDAIQGVQITYDVEQVWLEANNIHHTAGALVETPVYPGKKGFTFLSNYLWNQVPDWPGAHDCCLGIRGGDDYRIEGNTMHSCGRTGGVYMYDFSSPPGGVSLIFRHNLVYDTHNPITMSFQQLGDFVFEHNTIIGGYEDPDPSSEMRYYLAGYISGAADRAATAITRIRNNLLIGRTQISGLNSSDEGENIYWSLWWNGVPQSGFPGSSIVLAMGDHMNNDDQGHPYKDKYLEGTRFSDNEKFFVESPLWLQYSYYPEHAQNLNDAYFPVWGSPACDHSIDPDDFIGAFPCVEP